MKETWLKPCACIGCDHILDAASAVFDNAVPSPGDWTICLHCGTIMVFAENLSLREPNIIEAHGIAGNPMILRIQRARAEVMKQPTSDATKEKPRR